MSRIRRQDRTLLAFAGLTLAFILAMPQLAAKGDDAHWNPGGSTTSTWAEPTSTTTTAALTTTTTAPPWHTSEASWYSSSNGHTTGCQGVRWYAGIRGVAHKTYPCGSLVRFRYHGREVVVKVIDRGPYVAGRDWDLTAQTAQDLGFTGVHQIEWQR